MTGLRVAERVSREHPHLRVSELRRGDFQQGQSMRGPQLMELKTKGLFCGDPMQPCFAARVVSQRGGGARRGSGARSEGSGARWRLSAAAVAARPAAERVKDESPQGQRKRQFRAPVRGARSREEPRVSRWRAIAADSRLARFLPRSPQETPHNAKDKTG